MQPMHPHQREGNSSLTALFYLSKVSAFLIAVFFVPDLHDMTRDLVANKITENYGEELAYWGVLGWWAGLFALVYFGLTFGLQSAVVFLSTWFYSRHF